MYVFQNIPGDLNTLFVDLQYFPKQHQFFLLGNSQMCQTMLFYANRMKTKSKSQNLPQQAKEKQKTKLPAPERQTSPETEVTSSFAVATKTTVRPTRSHGYGAKPPSSSSSSVVSRRIQNPLK